MNIKMVGRGKSRNISQGQLWPMLFVLMCIHAALCWRGMNAGISKDEAVTAFDALMPSAQELLRSMPTIDLNPPLYPLFLQQWALIFGDQDFWLKVPSLIAGMLLIPATYYLGRLVSSHKTGLVAAVFITFSITAVYYSTILRGYVFEALVSALAVSAFVAAMNERGKGKATWLVVYTLLNAVAMYINYMGIVLCGCLAAWAIFRKVCVRSKFSLLPPLLSFGGAFVLFSPWLPVFLLGAKAGTPWAVRPPLFQWPLVFSTNVASYVPLPFFFAMSAIALFYIVCLLKWKESAKLLAGLPALAVDTRFGPLIFTALLPVCLMGYITPYYFGLYRYVYPFSAMAMVLLSVGLQRTYEGCLNARRWRKPEWQRFAVMALIVSVFLLSNVVYAFTAQSQRSGMKKLADQIKSGLYPRTVFLIGPDADVEALAFYLGYKSINDELPFVHGIATWKVPIAYDVARYGIPWQRPTLLDEALNNIKQIDRSKYDHLAYAIQKGYVADSDAVPTKRNVMKLLDLLKQRYPLVGVVYYPGESENEEVYVFDLNISD